MRHKDGFNILVQHQSKVLQEYDAVANSETPATNAGSNILHAGDYTARRTQFYVIPDKTGLDRLMIIKFFLAQNFDFQGGNLLNITLRGNGTASKHRPRSQLIWEHKVPGEEESDAEFGFFWKVSLLEKGNLGDSMRVEDDLFLTVTIERGVSNPRWENDNKKAMEAFERVPGGRMSSRSCVSRSKGSHPESANSLDQVLTREERAARRVTRHLSSAS